jgi:hypothetical protein
MQVVLECCVRDISCVGDHKECFDRKVTWVYCCSSTLYPAQVVTRRLSGRLGVMQRPLVDCEGDKQAAVDWPHWLALCV